MKKDKDKAVKTLRQYVVNTEDLKDILPRYRTKEESLTRFTRDQMVTTIHGLEEDLAHHKAYLDQILTVIINQNPQLLSMISEAHKMRYIGVHKIFYIRAATSRGPYSFLTICSSCNFRYTVTSITDVSSFCVVLFIQALQQAHYTLYRQVVYIGYSNAGNLKKKSFFILLFSKSHL